MRLKIALLVFVCMAIPRFAAGQTLFSEDWNSGSIDTSKWAVRGPTVHAIGVELPVQSSDGDFALVLRGIADPDFPTNQTWLDNIMSRVEFSRTDRVTMEFKAWTKPGSNAQIGVHGGFHHVSVAQTQQHYAFDLLNTPEATFDYFVNDIRASESGDSIQGTAGGVSFLEATQAIKANTKNGAATFRISLDAVQGALWQIVVPATNPAHSTNQGEPEIYTGRDTRGIPNYGEQTGHPTTVINNQIMNAIGFGLGASLFGSAYIDDILVYGPEGPSVPLLVGDYNDDDVVDSADYVVWRKNVGTNNMLANDPTGGTIGAPQYDQWRANFGNVLQSGVGGSVGTTAVPEPDASLLAVLGMAIALRLRRQ